MKKIFLMLFMLPALAGWAQPAILDLNLSPLVPSAETPAGYTDYYISVKLSDFSAAGTIYFMFGTQPDDGSVLSATATVSADGTGYTVTYNGEPIPVEAMEARWVCRLSDAQAGAYQYLTVYSDGPASTESNRLYWNKSN